ncbi:MAG: M18 family aminopeptidase [Fibrobacterota bacterium]
MNETNHSISELFSLISACPTPAHAVSHIGKRLKNAGFLRLDARGSWNLSEETAFYSVENSSCLFAFHPGDGCRLEDGLRIFCAHTDAPGFRVKPQGLLAQSGGLQQLNTEVYGGAILRSWLDRPLTLAGRVFIDDGKLREQLIHIDRPLCTIPEVAIHLNKTVNDGQEIKRQSHVLPLMESALHESTGGKIQDLLAAECACSPEEILSADLHVIPCEEGTRFGREQRLISAPRLDDFAMIHTGLRAFESAQNSAPTLLCLFDNEEVGSKTAQGADSALLPDFLARLVHTLGKPQETYHQMRANSFMISADMAHALHPAHVEKHDPRLQPQINGGPVIKYNANAKYTTDAAAAARFKQLCRTGNVPVQEYANRSDMPGGSTLGNLLTTHFPVSAVDMGNPLLAMHAVREVCGVDDLAYAERVFRAHFEHRD